MRYKCKNIHVFKCITAPAEIPYMLIDCILPKPIYINHLVEQFYCFQDEIWLYNALCDTNKTEARLYIIHDKSIFILLVAMREA